LPPLGELSARALTKTKGIHDAKNPYPAPISSARELFAPSAINDRNCVHVEFDIQGSGITYQHGDHVGVWPSNPDVEVDRLLFVLGLGAKNRRNAVINIESLDPALAKVPFPVPTTYVTALRHYLDISAVAGRQMLSSLSKIAPSQSAADTLLSLSQDKELYANVVAKGCLKLGEVLQYAAGDDITAVPSASNTTVWNIPFDVIVSALSRLTPRFYSISSSPKLVPNAIHVTCVVLKYQSKPPKNMKAKWVFGVGSNYLLNIKMASHGEQAPLLVENGDANPIHVTNPAYAIAGPRMAYHQGGILRAPIHVRRSTFRLPANPRSPIIMVGPGTVSPPHYYLSYRTIVNTAPCFRVSLLSVDSFKSELHWLGKRWRRMEKTL
jgi:NADPH-ferrihemoprotein reductase